LITTVVNLFKGLGHLKMRIGIIGSGNVSKTLAAGLIGNGHEVMLGTRDTSKLREWLEEAGPRAKAGTFTEVSHYGDIVFISVAGHAALEAVNLAGSEGFRGKTVIDLTNPLDFSNGLPPGFTATIGNSLGEQVQKALPEARVVKAFNSIGAAIMVNPRFGADTATLFIAGNDEAAKAETTSLAKEFGWDVEDLGGIDQGFFLEAFASLWINYGFKHNNWTHAFKFLKG
jgi:8-hydroxy-5-deazaflavin:NADPH oxidoreductase